MILPTSSPTGLIQVGGSEKPYYATGIHFKIYHFQFERAYGSGVREMGREREFHVRTPVHPIDDVTRRTVTSVKR